MNKYSNLHNKSEAIDGFTLVELMIVVAIIGILSAIAIPNYNSYQATARKTEGKLAMSGAYAAEKNYYAANSVYTPCLNTAGYAPDGYVAGSTTGSDRYYTVGFASVNCNSTICPWTDPPTNSIPLCGDTDGETYFVANKGWGTVPTGRADLTTGAVVSADGTTFSIGVVGNIGQ